MSDLFEFIFVVETDGTLDMVVDWMSTSWSSDQTGVGTFWTSDRWRSALSIDRHWGLSLCPADKYVLTNFVTLSTPPRNASSHLRTLQASTEYLDSCGHFSDPNSINMQHRCFVISWTKRKASMPIPFCVCCFNWLIYTVGMQIIN
jgi:hypothetical protein